MPNTKTAESLSLQQAFDQESAPLLAARMRPSLLLFYGLGGLGTAYEAYYFPERQGALIFIHVICAFILGGQIALAHILPRYAYAFAVSAANAMGLALGYYAIMVGLDTEILALTVAIVFFGVLILYPLGWKGQLVAGFGAVVGYLAAVYINAPPTVPSIYTASLLWAGYGMSALGAHVIDTYRFQAFARAAELQHTNDGLRQQNSLLLASDEARTPRTISARRST